MKSDMVNVVVKSERKMVGDSLDWVDTYLKEYVYCDSSAANDSALCKMKAATLEIDHGTPDRKYIAVRLDRVDAIKLGLVKE